ncbi:MAG: hypothetical protein M1826_004260 [Phylliscum demangeonii]|nr:MAG: hypothetical protein M1826_004260 [Phylliscum demangeonii]
MPGQKNYKKDDLSGDHRKETHTGSYHEDEDEQKYLDRSRDQKYEEDDGDDNPHVDAPRRFFLELAEHPIDELPRSFRWPNEEECAGNDPENFIIGQKINIGTEATAFALLPATEAAEIFFEIERRAGFEPVDASVALLGRMILSIFLLVVWLHFKSKESSTISKDLYNQQAGSSHASYTGGDRFMAQAFQDLMAIVRRFG